jgi:hypothetical protein
VADPKNLRLSRPYRNVDEYVAAEAWSIDARGMLLIDQEPMPAGTIVRFEIVLRSGAKPIRAEGRVVGPVEPTEDRPGGVRVRFRRLGPNCKEFIDRVLEARGSSPHASVELSSPTAAEAPLMDPDPTPPPLQSPSLTEGARPSVPTPTPAERSEVRTRDAGPVVAPANRDELLERLRSRTRRGG